MGKSYLGKKVIFAFGEESIFVNLYAEKEMLEKAGFEVEEVEESEAFRKMYKIIEEFQNEWRGTNKKT